jgi:hypothetical protein
MKELGEKIGNHKHPRDDAPKLFREVQGEAWSIHLNHSVFLCNLLGFQCVGESLGLYLANLYTTIR